MRVLLIKTSSMGDLIHILPALTDAQCAVPYIKFDWVVEEVFAEIPRWHAAVDRVIPVALRRWRKSLLASSTRKEWREFLKLLNSCHYDLILDAQGLLKSALLGCFARGKRAGPNWRSAREALASLLYQQKITVSTRDHAVLRMRTLMSKALGYPLPSSDPHFGLNFEQFHAGQDQTSYLVFLHGTTWSSKLWPVDYWQALALMAVNAGFEVMLSGGNIEELTRAKTIASVSSAVRVLPRQTIGAMANLLANAKGVVAVDTGFGHLAAALQVPTLSLYGPTNPTNIGAIGRYSQHLAATFPCAPCLKRNCAYQGPLTTRPACFDQISPQFVWERLIQQL